MSQDSLPFAFSEHTDKDVVEARFYVSSVKLTSVGRQKLDAEGKPVKNANGYMEWENLLGGSVEMSAAKHGTFGDATPSGQIIMLIQNEPAFLVFKDAFERGLRENKRAPRFRVYFVEDENQEPDH